MYCITGAAVKRNTGWPEGLPSVTVSTGSSPVAADGIDGEWLCPATLRRSAIKIARLEACAGHVDIYDDEAFICSAIMASLFCKKPETYRRRSFLDLVRSWLV